MRLSDFLYEAKKPEIVKIEVTSSVAVKDAEKIYDSDENLKKFLSRIHRPKLSDDRSGSFIYRVEEKDGEDKIRKGETIIRFNEDQGKKPSEVFAKIIKAIKTPKPKTWESILKKATETLGDASQQDFILTFFISKVSNPGVKPRSETLQSVENLPERYETFGKAMVFRAGKCVSKLTDVNTKINKENFQDIMQKCFGAATDSQGENDAFLAQFVRLKEKMQIDAAKYTIYVITKNGDIESTEESFYDSFIALLPMLMEAEDDKNVKDFIDLPKKVADFVNDDMNKALIQASNVAKKYPRQYNICYKRLEAAFEKGVNEQQEEERNPEIKELVDPITHEKVKRHGRAWGTGGPNGFIRDNKMLDKLCNDIKDNQPWTMFNCVGKTVLKIFDAIETGGKIYQKLCDDMAEGYKNIMHSFGTTRGDDFGKLADNYSKDGKQNNALGVDMAGVVFGITKIYKLLGEGKIGTINGKFKTVSTINKNNTSLIQDSLNELADSIARFTKKKPEYNKWKEDKDKEIETKIKKFEEQIKKLEAGRTTENPNASESTKSYVNIPNTRTIKQLINEEEENKKQASVKEEIANAKEELEKLKKKKNSQVQVNLENYYMLLDEYSNAAGHIGEIADIHSFLVKMFDENEAKEQYAKMYNKKDSNEGSSDEDSGEEIIDSFKLNIKNPFVNEEVEFEEDEEPEGGEEGSTEEKNNDKMEEPVSTPKGEGKEGNLDWIETKSGHNLVELYRQFGVNINNTKLDISSLKRMAKEKNQNDILKNFSTIVDSLNEFINHTEINPITDGVIAFDYAFGEDADENKFKTLANAFNLEGFGDEEEAKKKAEEEKKKRNENGVFTVEELEQEMNELGKLLDSSSKAMKTTSELNGFVNTAENDQWVTEYGNKIKEVEDIEKEIWEKCFRIYNDKDKNTRKGNEWLKQKLTEANGQVFLNKLWITLSTAKYIGEQVKKKIETAKMKEEHFIVMNKFMPPLLTENDDDNDQKTGQEVDGTKKRHTVETAINTYNDNLSKLDFNVLVPKDIKDAKFDITKGKEFNAMETKIAEGRLGTRAENDSNLPKSVLKNVIGDPQNKDNKIYKALESSCKRMMDYIVYGAKAKNLKGDDRDIYLLAGCMIGVCKAMQKLKNTPEGQEDHRDKSTAHPQQGPEGTKVEAGTPKKEESYIDSRSKNSLINEIYKYIRG